ncbi:hydroxymethylglutaryl-CoA reductase, degradative [Maribacter sp. 1_2014MBL_MicDiv]|uniref:hydroxymethylglutaryl-CoA reductase, degradative n=1 Tax=Maribacter sp. 1_2014MBL_MicDiv TaxID=1644130 RepID=UPI0008F4DE5C|nr:hydroxymethylglutaryl-CoA reductase, degradative [Maribacter sp. 1_2014MBL_MicDiv]APA63840.1 hydroxymethylglutaryl-CoA reductase [Maribacter sp. 1_2014MBL_MicDiv]
MTEPISGFSKLSKEEKIDWITTNYTQNAAQSRKILQTYWNIDQNVQQLHDEFIENTITNLYVPQGIAPNFLINNTLYAIPMAIEESSVIAAASKAAKFWLKKGGFKTTILGTEKVGQVHFIYKGDTNRLNSFFTYLKPILLAESASLTSSMEKRGGGITDIDLKDKTKQLENYYQLHATFETKDAMGANFINSCLEQFAATLKKEAGNYDDFSPQEKDIEVVMSILSNYVPNCSVRAEVSCPVEDLNLTEELTPQHTAEKIVQAINIAHIEPYRAVTHNKGVMNGIDAVVLATGNDFRAIEAGVHAYACRNGQYSSLTHASIEDGIFTFWIELPLALGTVGGLTNLHPLVKLNLEILQRPSAEELMQIIAVAGLAQNFAAVSSLVTTGIQKGHMKMHLLNILNQLGANENEKAKLVTYFKTNPVTHHGVELQLNEIRK